jgi:hypothetical protein
MSQGRVPRRTSTGVRGWVTDGVEVVADCDVAQGVACGVFQDGGVSHFEGFFAGEAGPALDLDGAAVGADCQLGHVFSHGLVVLGAGDEDQQQSQEYFH